MLGATNSDKTTQIGSLLRQRRKELGMTLKDLAAKSGLSSPFISQAERNHTTPSLVSLTRLADALDVDLKYFMEVPHDSSIVHRGDDLKEIEVESPVSYFNMSTDLPDKQMDVILMTIPPGHDFPTDRRAGEDFLYVVDGELEAVVGDVKTTLRKGDGMHFDSRIPHTAKNRSEAVVTLLYVGTPSFFT